MDSDRMSMIEDWPIPESVQHVQVLLGFANFYRRLIQQYVKVKAHISNLLERKGSQKWQWTRDAELVFRKLKQTFTKALIVQYFHQQKPIILQTDARGFAIPGILNHYNRLGSLRPDNYYSRKCSHPEKIYNT